MKKILLLILLVAGLQAEYTTLVEGVGLNINLKEFAFILRMDTTDQEISLITSDGVALFELIIPNSQISNLLYSLDKIDEWKPIATKNKTGEILKEIITFTSFGRLRTDSSFDNCKSTIVTFYFYYNEVNGKPISYVVIGSTTFIKEENTYLSRKYPSLILSETFFPSLRKSLKEDYLKQLIDTATAKSELFK